MLPKADLPCSAWSPRRAFFDPPDLSRSNERIEVSPVIARVDQFDQGRDFCRFACRFTPVANQEGI